MGDLEPRKLLLFWRLQNTTCRQSFLDILVFLDFSLVFLHFCYDFKRYSSWSPLPLGNLEKRHSGKEKVLEYLEESVKSMESMKSMEGMESRTSRKRTKRVKSIKTHRKTYKKKLFDRCLTCGCATAFLQASIPLRIKTERWPLLGPY